MPGPGQNNLKNFLLNPKVQALLGLIIVGLIIFPLIKNVNQRRKVNREIKELEEEIKTVSDKNNDLKKMINYLESDQFLEEQARLNFGFKKPGEEVAVVKTNNDGQATSSSASGEAGNIYDIPGWEKSQPAKLVSNPQKWWKYFFN